MQRDLVTRDPYLLKVADLVKRQSYLENMRVRMITRNSNINFIITQVVIICTIEIFSNCSKFSGLLNLFMLNSITIKIRMKLYKFLLN